MKRFVKDALITTSLPVVLAEVKIQVVPSDNEITVTMLRSF